MATKSFKIGEYAIGGIIKVDIKGKTLSIQALDYYSKKPVSSGSVMVDEHDSYWKVSSYLHELTSSYYADQIMKFIKSKTTLSNNSNYLDYF